MPNSKITQETIREVVYHGLCERLKSGYEDDLNLFDSEVLEFNNLGDFDFMITGNVRIKSDVSLIDVDVDFEDISTMKKMLDGFANVHGESSLIIHIPTPSANLSDYIVDAGLGDLTFPILSKYVEDDERFDIDGKYYIDIAGILHSDTNPDFKTEGGKEIPMINGFFPENVAIFSKSGESKIVNCLDLLEKALLDAPLDVVQQLVDSYITDVEMKNIAFRNLGFVPIDACLILPEKETKPVDFDTMGIPTPISKDKEKEENPIDDTNL